MKKIPSLFMRDFDGDPARVLPIVTAGCEWVLADEGVATRKRDGTATMVDTDGALWRRYDAKGGKTPPDGFVSAQPEPDHVTKHWPGWLKVGNGPQDKWYHATKWPRSPGTYELCGPKFQTNAENLIGHEFFRHGLEVVSMPRMADLAALDVAGVFKLLSGYFQHLDMEGVVWHHPDGRMAKLKRSDFGLDWPIGKAAR